MEFLETMIIAKANYWAVIILMMIGMWTMIAKNNLVKKIIGMNIFQTAIILFYVSIAVKKDATIPIIKHGADHSYDVAQAVNYINPLPHVLMLTAIVVSVATLGVALALVLKIHNRHNTLEEDEILEDLRK